MSKNEDKINYIKSLILNNELLNLESSDLLNIAKNIKKYEDQIKSKINIEIKGKKIGILSSSTSYFFKIVLKLFLYQQGIDSKIYEANYNSINEQIINDKSELYLFKPDVLLILPDYRDIKHYPSLFSESVEIEKWTKTQCLIYKNLWERICVKLNKCQIIHGLFVIPNFRNMGVLEGNYIFSQHNVLKLLNLELVKDRPGNVLFIDLDYHASMFGKSKWLDDSQYFMNKQSISFDALGTICHATSKIISAHFGKIKKCLVLDLDNTLWGGVVGDDGIDGINLEPTDSLGEAYLAFQNYIKELKNRGIILAVCSKNDAIIAKSVFEEHPNMVLRLEDISCFIANWNDKSSNVRKIADELNIGLDSIVFFDDNPAEREIIKKYVPEVEVIQVPEDPAEYVTVLDQARSFEWTQLTTDDTSRSESYVNNRKRTEHQKAFLDYNDYLKSLEMEAVVLRNREVDTTRFTQLINKTNQFNVRAKKYSESKIIGMLNSLSKYKLIQIKFNDKFGQYGLISSIILEKISDKLFINTWVLSCRVFNRGLENLSMYQIISSANEWGCKVIVGEYIDTKRNGFVKKLYKDLGFNYDKNFSDIDLLIEGEAYTFKISNDQLKYPHYILEKS